MAGEIVVSTQGRRIVLVFLYPIPTPLLPNGVKVVPTPTLDEEGNDALPPFVLAALTAGEVTSLDAGDSAWETASLWRDEKGSTGAELLAEARRLYAIGKAEFDADYAVRYARSGDRFDAA